MHQTNQCQILLRAFRLKPDFIQVYASGSYARSKRGDQQGVADFQIVAQHYAAQGDQISFQRPADA